MFKDQWKNFGSTLSFWTINISQQFNNCWYFNDLKSDQSESVTGPKTPLLVYGQVISLIFAPWKFLRTLQTLLPTYHPFNLILTQSTSATVTFIFSSKFSPMIVTEVLPAIGAVIGENWIKKDSRLLQGFDAWDGNQDQYTQKLSLLCFSSFLNFHR